MGGTGSRQGVEEALLQPFSLRLGDRMGPPCGLAPKARCLRLMGLWRAWPGLGCDGCLASSQSSQQLFRMSPHDEEGTPREAA